MASSNIIVEKQLHDRLASLAKKMSADALAYCGPLVFGIDIEFRNAIENIANKKNKLIIVLETGGGYIEVVQRIVHTIRHHYETVEFIVPDYAMSAGTVFVMSGDAIHMDYFSVLGPIDPQVERPDQSMVPGLGYLKQYERLIEKSQNNGLSLAELHYLVERFDPAELYKYEQARELSIALLKEWLVKYKFKNWTRTETRGKPVTGQMKTRCASNVAIRLNNTDFWHTHGYGISIEVLRKHVKVQIEDFGTNKPISTLIRSYHRLLIDYMQKRNTKAAIHTKDNYSPIF